jgi:predicted CoA-substrate-specific enzyme activase
MNYYAGIDIGSTSIKTVLIDDQETIIDSSTIATGSLFHKNTMEAYNALLNDNDLCRDDVAYIVSTGYGRKLFKVADETISEITANAVGAAKIGKKKSGRIRTIINIGGQDLKVITLDDDGHVVNFAMNDKCAAGTGRFLEMTARNLEIEVDALGPLHLQAEGIPVTINSTCTVFAESEIISLLANNYRMEDIVAGIHYSIARRVVRLARRLGVVETIFFDGGPAMNAGLVTAMEDELMRPVVVPEQPQLTTAIGAALIARDIYASSGEQIDAA